ncbi:MAG: OmpA family protein [Bacteroidota bacterium]|nr:OmpA family protein [Bacteroidota bacterium]
MKSNNSELLSGIELYNKGNYRQATIMFKKCLTLKKNFAEAYYWLGKCYELSPSKDSAVKYYQTAFDIDFESAPDILYRLGRAYHLNLQFDEAENYYDKYMTYVNDKICTQIGSSVLEEKMKTRRRIEECQNAKLIYYHMYEHDINLIDQKVNTIFPEYAPFVSGDGKTMVFTARRPQNMGYKMDEDNLPFEDIWISRKNMLGNWDLPENLGPPVNTPSHDACIAISSDSKTLLLYRADNGGDIYISKQTNNNWSKPEPISKKINTKYKEPSACFSKDGKTIYFSSNRPEGHGGLDIYYSKMDKDGKWSDPVNMGTRINSELDEDAPFISPDGTTLFFSSNGHNCMGGYDIFSVKFDKKTNKWKDPINIGYPINSADDDIYFSLADNGKHAYFASARKGGVGDKDLYYIALDSNYTQKALVSGPDGLKVQHFLSSKPLSDYNMAGIKMNKSVATVITNDINEFVGNNRITYKIKVTDVQSKAPLTCKVDIHQLHSHKRTIELNTNELGELVITLPKGYDYSIDVEKEGYIFYSSMLHLPQDVTITEKKEDMALHKPKKGERFTLRNIFFESGESELDPESNTELDFLVRFLLKYNKLKLEISGHTDNRGSVKINKELSQKRAIAIYEYLISHGVPKERLVTKGYGSDRPVASNDVEEGRKQNRRTEFEIID